MRGCGKNNTTSNDKRQELINISKFGVLILV